MLLIGLITVGDPTRLTGGYLYQRRLVEGAGAAGAVVTTWSLPDAWLEAQRRAAPGILREAARHSDVLVIDSLAAAGVTGSVGAVAVPLVALVHQAPGGPARSRLRRELDIRTYRACATVIATGRGLAAELRLLGLDRPEVLVPGTERAADVPAVAGMRGGRRAAVLCVANASPTKNVAELVAAMRHVPNATLHLVGGSYAQARYGRRVQRLAEPLGDAVVFHGSREPEEVARFRAGADIFALPSLEESYGMAWTEAMAAGLPVIGYRISNLPDLVADGVEGLLVPPHDVGGLAGAIRSLADDEPLRNRLGAAARERAATFPTWEATTRRFVSVLRSVATQPSSR